MFQEENKSVWYQSDILFCFMLCILIHHPDITLRPPSICSNQKCRLVWSFDGDIIGTSSPFLLFLMKEISVYGIKVMLYSFFVVHTCVLIWGITIIDSKLYLKTVMCYYFFCFWEMKWAYRVQGTNVIFCTVCLFIIIRNNY